MELPPSLVLPQPVPVHQQGTLGCGLAMASRVWRAAEPKPAATAPSSPGPRADYRQQIKPSPAGWPRRDHWCVWMEPLASSSGPASIWDQRWQRAVQDALASWQRQLPITLVDDPAAAQVLVWRRRPPLLNQRASHGRAVLQLLEVQRGGGWQLEPRVDVLISPEQAQLAIQATALHELGHAFGLWGHSDQSGDAMSARPSAPPVLQLSPRDRATLEWLQQQPALHQR